MKYVPVENAMTALLRRLGMSVFDPYQFDEHATREVIGLLQAAVDSPAPPAQSAAAAPASARPAPPAQPVLAARSGAPLVLVGVALVFAAGAAFALLR